jgi:hypothetical protein
LNELGDMKLVALRLVFVTAALPFMKAAHFSAKPSHVVFRSGGVAPASPHALASKTKLAASLLARRHADNCEGRRLQIDHDLLRRAACRRSAPAVLPFSDAQA